MVGGRADGSKFSVRDAQGMASFFGRVGVAGTWGKWNVYVLDFTIAKSGTYSIEVTGEFAAQSPLFKVDTTSNLYSAALSNALAFYQNQRDGRDFIPSDLRKAAGHLNDQSAKVYQTPETGGREGWRLKSTLVPTGAVIDASDGWWDAGDYLKFVHTASYVTAMMLVGRRDFPNQMGPGTPASDFTHEAKFGLDWLLRMWDGNSHTLYYQVGIGSWAPGMENDHSVWRLPQEDDTSHVGDARYRYIRNRPVFIAGAVGSKISPNLAGRLAGDFALCYQIFHAADQAYANRCLLAAEHIFDLADTALTLPLLTAVAHDFYGETEWYATWNLLQRNFIWLCEIATIR
jgi:endoglucanase